MPFQPTAQQAAIIGEIVSGSGHLAVQAYAGTGKSTTSLQGAKAYAAAFPSHEVMIVAFGKAIADENAERLRELGLGDWKRYASKTAHALGMSLCMFFFKPEVDEKKVSKLIKAQNDGRYETFGAVIGRLVSLAKRDGFGFFGDRQIGDTGAWYALAEHHNLNNFDNTNDMDVVIECAQAIYKLSLGQTKVIDYDDMVLFPLVYNIVTRFQKDLIIVDEYQDISRARDALIKKFLKPGGRMVIVGDKYQAIMGFTGAAATAMDDGIEALSAKVLPLSVTWRCPKAVVELARRFVPAYEAADGAPEGEVLYASDSEDTPFGLPADLTTDGEDAILCRNTAPLIEIAYDLIRKRIPAKIEGRDIASGLKNLVQRWKVTKTSILLQRVDTFEAKQVQKYKALDSDEMVERMQDLCETVRVIVREVNRAGKTDVADVVAYIDDLFVEGADEGKGSRCTTAVILCTYHRSKGREWRRVTLYEHASRCPSKAARKPWQLEQEKNLAYVAMTRAKQTLVITE